MSRRRTSEQIRAEFLDFFRERGHEIVASASLVPQNDPTLLFTNAGMNQFKDVFLGEGDRPYDRAADTQKCLRVSGKHNDLEEVGYDTYHHTFFEMLGNWSFGDYFKADAIAWAWELLVDRWGLDPDRLYVTVHEGDDALGLAPDDEAAALWRDKTSVRPDHILPGNSKDNFWMMGDTGPCGPCSEIHVDLRTDEERAASPGAALVNRDDPRVMEIWNLVFIQYNAQPDGTLKPLAAQHVDTGMGFERIVAVLQGKTSNYDTDLFAPVLARVAALCPRDDVRGYDDLGAVETDTERERVRVALRVIADHVRTVAFAVADGVVPGNTGAAYVIRRILRRAVRYGYQTLGFREPFLHRLVEPLADKMGGAFPELVRGRDYIERVIRAEEEGFLETLGTGLAFFERIVPYVETLAGREETAPKEAIREALDRLRADRTTFDLLEKAYSGLGADAILDRFSTSAAERRVPGEVAFLLHDTYGFPVDLTSLMAREEGLGVDMPRYDELMKAQKTRARAAASFKVDQSSADTWTTVGRSEDSAFVGYDALSVEDAGVRAVRTVGEGDDARHEIVLDRTPFYAESGGQVGDTGVLVVGDEEVRVLDVQKQQDRIVHVVDRLPSDLDAPVSARVDEPRRRRIMKHHSVTHLLHAALRETLGPHVAQKGSLVAPDRLRFDFSHFERVGPDELAAVEARVNEMIQRNIPKGEERGVPMAEATARGATALFGEKYGDSVRVITFDPEYSVELCGGTHVGATGEIGLFRFLGEGSVAAGVRRVEAVAGLDALGHVRAELDELTRTRGHFRQLARPLDEEVGALLEQTRTLEKEIDALRRERLAGQLDALIAGAETLNADGGAVRLVTGRVEPTDMDALRTLGTTLRDRLGAGAVGVLGAVDPDGEKVYLVATVSDDLVGRGVKAGAVVGALARRVGGGGGGRPTLATAGGRRPEELDGALAAAREVVGEAL